MQEGRAFELDNLNSICEFAMTCGDIPYNYKPDTVLSVKDLNLIKRQEDKLINDNYCLDGRYLVLIQLFLTTFKHK